MARNNKINMPSTGGGLTRYFDDYKSKIEFSPQQVIFAAVVVILGIIMLHMFA